MRIVPVLLMCSIVLVVSACQPTRWDGQEESPYFVIPVGSTLTLSRDLAFSPQQLGLYMQNGQIVPPAQINLYRPHCKLELNKRLDTPQTIKPETFVVTRVVQDILHSVRSPAEGMHARHRTGDHRRVDGGGGISPQLYGTQLLLRSALGQNVLALVCGHTESQPYGAVHLSIRQIRAALGGILTLNVAAPARP